MAQLVYIGINGNVICLDRSTGEGLWLAELKGTNFVNLLVDGDRIIATTSGEAYCLDASNGKILWHNELSGQGRGLATIATSSGTASSTVLAEKQRQAAAAAAGAAGASAAIR